MDKTFEEIFKQRFEETRDKGYPTKADIKDTSSESRIVTDILMKHSKFFEIVSFQIGDEIKDKNLFKTLNAYSLDIIPFSVIGYADFTVRGNGQLGLIFSDKKFVLITEKKHPICINYKDIREVIVKGGKQLEFCLIDGTIISETVYFFVNAYALKNALKMIVEMLPCCVEDSNHRLENLTKNQFYMLDLLKNWLPSLLDTGISIYPMIDRQKADSSIKSFAHDLKIDEILAYKPVDFFENGKEAIIFTSDGAYLKGTEDGDYKICWIPYGEIRDTYPVLNRKEKIKKLEIVFNNDRKVLVDNIYIKNDKLNIFLAEVCATYALLSKGITDEYEINAAQQYAAVGNLIKDIGNIYEKNVIFQANQGHGYAAEQVNYLYDKITLKQPVGDFENTSSRNAKNGFDRHNVKTGEYIQTKYYENSTQLVRELFKNGTPRYVNEDGTLTTIEVAPEKINEILTQITKRYGKGEIQTDYTLEEILETVKPGKFSLPQVKNIAKAGTIESISFDAVNGTISSFSNSGITGVITLSINLWNGNDLEESLKDATNASIDAFGIGMVTNIVVAQVGRTSIEKALRPVSNKIVNVLGSKSSSTIAKVLSGKDIYGVAAKNHVSKLIRGNIVTSVVVTGVLESVNIARLIDGQISSAQLVKGLTKTGTSVTVGVVSFAAGAKAGAALGASIGTVVPVLGNIAGTVVGGVVGLGVSFIASGVATAGVGKILDALIEDDAIRMVKIFESIFSSLGEEYLLNELEIKNIAENIQRIYNLDQELRYMFKLGEDDKREKYAKLLISPIIKAVIRYRPTVLINDDLFIEGVGLFMEENLSV